MTEPARETNYEFSSSSSKKRRVDIELSKIIEQVIPRDDSVLLLCSKYESMRLGDKQTHSKSRIEQRSAAHLTLKTENPGCS